MGQPQGEEEEEGWDVEGRVMTRGYSRLICTT